MWCVCFYCAQDQTRSVQLHGGKGRERTGSASANLQEKGGRAGETARRNQTEFQ